MDSYKFVSEIRKFPLPAAPGWGTKHSWWLYYLSPENLPDVRDSIAQSAFLDCCLWTKRKQQ